MIQTLRCSCLSHLQLVNLGLEDVEPRKRIFLSIFSENTPASVDYSPDTEEGYMERCFEPRSVDDEPLRRRVTLCFC